MLMLLRLSLVSCVVLQAGLLAADDYKVTALDAAAPEGLSAEVAAGLGPQALRLSGPDGDVFDLWLLKSLETQAGFSPTLMVTYPFTGGQLIGALKVTGAGFTDFRGQDVPPGVYTLRYGLQPEDGNHIGTSEVSDFILALPAKLDQAPAIIADFDTLAKHSAQSVGTTHPAIFSLLPAEDAAEEPALTHDEDRELWILNFVGATADGKQVPIKLVVIGEAEA
jgi:hypothetical protein